MKNWFQGVKHCKTLGITTESRVIYECCRTLYYSLDNFLDHFLCHFPHITNVEVCYTCIRGITTKRIDVRSMILKYIEKHGISSLGDHKFDDPILGDCVTGLRGRCYMRRNYSQLHRAGCPNLRNFMYPGDSIMFPVSDNDQSVIDNGTSNTTADGDLHSA